MQCVQQYKQLLELFIVTEVYSVGFLLLSVYWTEVVVGVFKELLYISNCMVAFAISL